MATSQDLFGAKYLDRMSFKCMIYDPHFLLEKKCVLLCSHGQELLDKLRTKISPCFPYKYTYELVLKSLSKVLEFLCARFHRLSLIHI